MEKIKVTEEMLDRVFSEENLLRSAMMLTERMKKQMQEKPMKDTTNMKTTTNKQVKPNKK